MKRCDHRRVVTVNRPYINAFMRCLDCGKEYRVVRGQVQVIKAADTTSDD